MKTYLLVVEDDLGMDDLGAVLVGIVDGMLWFV
jgi:hypothetical protein